MLGLLCNPNNRAQKAMQERNSWSPTAVGQCEAAQAGSRSKIQPVLLCSSLQTAVVELLVWNFALSQYPLRIIKQDISGTTPSLLPWIPYSLQVTEFSLPESIVHQLFTFRMAILGRRERKKGVNPSYKNLQGSMCTSPYSLVLKALQCGLLK